MDVHKLMKTLQEMKCPYDYEPYQDPRFALCGGEGPKDIAQRVTVSQAHFYFDAAGKFLGVLADDMGYWKTPADYEGDEA